MYGVDDRFAAFPRLQRLRDEIAKLIPCPHEADRQELREAILRDLLARYINWRDRFIRPRPRRVFEWDGFHRHGKIGARIPAVLGLVAAIERGDDLRPYLSDVVEKNGYIGRRKRPEKRPKGIEWGDKDYVLNAYEVHHLHLAGRPAKGKAGRTKELAYVCFARDSAFLLMVGDHASFEDGTLYQALAEARRDTVFQIRGIEGLATERTAAENNRLQRAGISTMASVGGDVVAMAMLSAAGTNILHTRHADRLTGILEAAEQRLAERDFGRTLFAEANLDPPADMRFEWQFQYCDLYLIEQNSGTEFLFGKWKR